MFTTLIGAWSFVFLLVVRFLPSRYLDTAFIMDLPFIMCLPAFVIHKNQATVRESLLQFMTPLALVAVNLVLYRLVDLSTALPILPFTPATGCKSWEEVVHDAQATGKLPPARTRTLRRRPVAAAVWGTFVLTAAAYLASGAVDAFTNDTTTMFRSAVQLPYFGIAWASLFPATVIAYLTFVGAELGPGRYILPVSVPLLWFLQKTAFDMGVVVFRNPTAVRISGVPIEELLLIYLTSHAILLTRSLLDHLNVLLLLDPKLPLVPVNDFGLNSHGLYWRMMHNPPEVDMRMLASIVYLDKQLRKECPVKVMYSPRKFRIPFLVLNSWYMAVASMVRYVDCEEADVLETRRRTLAAIKLFLVQAYDEQTPALERVFTLCTIPHAEPKDHALFYLFATLLPRLVPIYPFLDLCDCLSVDAAFMPESDVALAVRIANSDFDLDAYLPIQTTEQLRTYTTLGHGSFFAAYTYLSWSVLRRCPGSPARPVNAYPWAESVRGTATPLEPLDEDNSRPEAILHARSLGHAFGLIAIANNVREAARECRFYIPVSSFASTSELLSVMSGLPPPKHVILPLLDAAEGIMRAEAPPLLAALPRGAREDVRGHPADKARIAAKLRAGYA